MMITTNKKSKAWSGRKVLLRSLRAVTAVLLLNCFIPAVSQANTEVNILFPNGEYAERTEDMRVAALGGEVRLDRTWQNSRWYINPLWSNLRFVSDSIDNSIKVIDRAGTLYTRSGNSDTFIFEQVFIKKTMSGWRWYDRQGNWITYDEKGRITSYGDNNNLLGRFVFDSEGRRTALHDHFDQLIYRFEYDSQERLVKVSDRIGRTVDYHWNGKLLTKVTDIMGNDWSYSYDKNGQLIQRTEPDGGSVKIGLAYSVKAPNPALDSGISSTLPSFIEGISSTKDNGKETKVAQVGKLTDKTGAVTLWNIKYDKNKQQYTVSQDDPLGKKTVTQYDAEGRILSQSLNGKLKAQITRDGKYLEKVTDERGLTIAVHYDSFHHPVKIVYPDGSSESIKYDYAIDKPISYTDSKETLIQWKYDGKGNLLRQTEAVGKPEQRDLVLEYDNYGQVTSATYSDAISSVTTHRSYDNFGNVVSFTDAEGYIHHYQYTVDGQISEYQSPSGQRWQYEYNHAGNLISITNPLNYTVHATYDAMGRLTSVTDPLGNLTAYQYGFDTNGWFASQTNALSQTVTNRYDVIFNPVKYESASGLTEQIAYDNDGRPSLLTDVVGNQMRIEYAPHGSEFSGLPVAAHYPTYKEGYRFNRMNQLTEIKQFIDEQNASVSKMDYDVNGEMVSITEPGGLTTLYKYDAYGNVIEETDAAGGVMRYTWNLFNDLASVTDPNGNTHVYTYDRNGNLVQELQPSGAKIQYGYDEDGLLIRKQDAAGNITVYQYDAAERLITETITAAGETTPQQTVTYCYNAADRLVEMTQTGQTHTHFIYMVDALGRIVQEDITYGKGDSAFTKTLKYDYDVDGNLNGLTYPDNSKTSFSFENGLLKQATLPDGNTIKWQGYQWLQPTEIQFPGSTQKVSYDALMRPLQIQVQAGETLLMNRGYQYDPAHNIAKRSTENGDFNYRYDRANRLTQATPPPALQQKGLPVESYAYDNVGNRIGSAHQPGEWQYGADNRLLTMGSGPKKTSFHYSPSGQPTQKIQVAKQTDYTYDANDRLIQVAINGQDTASYQYDPLGRRISKTVNEQTTWFLYTDEGLIAELDEQGNMNVAYGWQPDTVWGTAPLWQANLSEGQSLETAEYHFLHTDHLGTPQIAVNAEGEITWRGIFESFGKVLLDDANRINMNLRFPGQYYDEETDSHYNYLRDYNPDLGRYLQRDPVGLAGGVNLYGYAFGNPLMYADPYGMFPWGAIIIPIIVIVGIDYLTAFLGCQPYTWENFIIGVVSGLIRMPGLKLPGKPVLPNKPLIPKKDPKKPKNENDTPHEIVQSGKAPKQYKPNSIYDVQRQDGSRSITYYDKYGRQFSREDYGQQSGHGTLPKGSDGRLVPHEHKFTYNNNNGYVSKGNSYYRPLDKNGKPIGDWIPEPTNRGN